MSKRPSRNTERLEEMVYTYFQHLLKNKSEDFTPELEMRFTGCVDGEYTNDVQALTKDNYYDVLQVFKSLNPTISSISAPTDEYLLRIYPFHNGRSSPFRCEITGLHDIQQYCITNDWKACPSARFVRKEKVYEGGNLVDDIYMDSYAIKASYKREITYNARTIDLDPQLKEIANNWSKVEKTFRHMNRVSFTVGERGLVKVDASIVKSSNQDNKKSFIPVRDIHQSNVFKNFEKYEIELEVNNDSVLANKNAAISSEQYSKLLTKEIQKAIHKVLVGLQKSPFPIPKYEMVYVLEEYIRNINLLNLKVNIRDFVGKQGLTSPKNFIGPSSVTLQFENLYNHDTTKTEAPFVKRNYTVTEKADGTRCLLFVVPNTLKTYLIDMNMRVTYTGLHFNNDVAPLSGIVQAEGLEGLIADGELITKDKNSNPIFMFMAFDIYFIGLKSMREKPFMGKLVFPPFKKRSGSRWSILDFFINTVMVDNMPPNSQDACKIGVKQFEVIEEPTPDSPEEMDLFHQACAAVLTKDYIYNVDGLIFTPAFLAVGATEANPLEPGPLTKIRWPQSFKWKPPQYNTNDFLVTTVKTETNDDRVTNLIEPYTNAAGAVQMIQYKTLELRCGFSPKKSGFRDAFTSILSMQKMEQIREEYRDVNYYKPTLFYPTDYPDRYSHICNVVMEPDESGLMQMITEEGEPIDDNTIVEFRYEHSNQDGFKWVPLRLRNDKTHEYRRGLKAYGNDYETANGNWKSIMNPITTQMLTTGVLPPYDEVMVNSDAYYTKSSAGDRDILQKFHNYVKDTLIGFSVKRGQTLIDLACGKAGDLWKWDLSKPSFVFGVDYSRDNIENRFDGAAARYMNYYKDRMNADNRRGPPPETIRCVFATGDASKNIRNGEALLNDVNREISNAVFGIGGGARDSIIGNLYGIGSDGFDACSCQFALHYFFRNATTLEGFMTNVCQNVKMGGYFVGTCYDGKRVIDLIEESGGTEAVVYSNETEYWRCVKKFEQTTFENDASSLGYGIDVYQKSIGLVHTEYLVNFDYLNRVMENYGFETVRVVPFAEIYETLNPANREKYRALENMPENVITFLNNTFVFRKIRDVDPLLVSLDRTPISEREEKREEIELEKEETKIKTPEPEPEPEPHKVPTPEPAPAPVPEPTKPAIQPKPAKETRTRKCKETEELVDGRCLKKCNEGEFRNPSTNRCNKTKKNK